MHLTPWHAMMLVLIGLALGSVVNQYLGGRAVQGLFAVLLLAVAGQMVYRAIQGA